MERAVPVRSSHASTAGMLAWPHPEGAGAPPPRRPNQPTEEFRKVVFGGHDHEEAAGAGGLNKMRPGSAPKGKEMAGSGVFVAETAAATAPAASSRDRQTISTVSQITFAEDGSIPKRKPTSVAEVARQRELSRTVESEGDGRMKRQVSNSKSKELTGHDIFADRKEDSKPNRTRRSEYLSSASHSLVKNANVSTFSFGEAVVESRVKTAKKVASSKFAVLTGKDVFEGDSGRRTRQPPGGDSSISLA